MNDKFKERRGRPRKPPLKRWSLRILLPTYKAYEEFLDTERNMTSAYKRVFNDQERIVIFCKFRLKWGRGKMIRCLGLGKTLIKETYKKIRQCDDELHGGYK